MTKIHKGSQVAQCIYPPKKLVQREEDSTIPSLGPPLSSREALWVEEIALSETLGPAPSQWLNTGMSQDPYVLVVVPPAHLVPCGTLKLLGKPAGGQKGFSFHLVLRGMVEC